MVEDSPMDSPEALSFSKESLRPIPSSDSPMLALPAEIVSEVFLNFLPPYPDFPDHTGLLSPILLCQICSFWRQIALSTPALWRAVGIDLRINEDPTTLIQKLDVLQTWLSRSGACPLSIRLRYDRNMQVGDSPPSLPQFMDALLPYRLQWEHLDLIMPHELLHRIKGEMPLLKSLTFGPSEFPEDDVLSDCFAQAPNLTTAVLGEYFLPSVMRLPWTQLTSLEGACLYEHECVQIVALTPALIHFKAKVVADTSETHHVDPCVCPALRTMILTVGAEAEIANVLNMLTLPALRVLEVPEPFVSTGNSIPVLKELMKRSRCAGLEELRIQWAVISEDEYREAFPEVQSLIVWGRDRRAT
ncbi:hypothetical protein R3P38DRAFT_1298338 [Favolaschia claudopus]|uniref:F-box domain-containing protein n=1 Tax=Favolaschia claudopus TaxID=2862362 RepID=A0AAW0AXQ7_9AGAR